MRNTLFISSWMCAHKKYAQQGFQRNARSLDGVCLKLFFCVSSLQNRQPMMTQMSSVSNVNLPLRASAPNQVGHWCIISDILD